MSAHLQAIVRDMAEGLSSEKLTEVLLTAIPKRELRWFQPPTREGRPGVRVQPRTPDRVYGEFYTNEVIQQFPDDKALEYLELVRKVVQDPVGDAETLVFLREELAVYRAKKTGVPDYFHSILVIFEQWDKVTPHAPVASATDPQEALLNLLLTQLIETK
jgi:hypothetical protein